MSIPTDKEFENAFKKYAVGGPITDKELEWLLSHYENMRLVLKRHVMSCPDGKTHWLQYIDAIQNCDRLRGYKQSREERKKRA